MSKTVLTLLLAGSVLALASGTAGAGGWGYGPPYGPEYGYHQYGHRDWQRRPHYYPPRAYVREPHETPYIEPPRPIVCEPGYWMGRGPGGRPWCNPY